MKQAKPKPWYRPRNVFLAFVTAVVLFFGWPFLEVWQVYTAEPRPTIDYRAKLRELAEQHTQVSPEVADEAWQLLLTAIDLSKTIQVQAEADLIVSGFSPRSEWDNSEIDFSYVRSGVTLSYEIERERSCLNRMREQGVMAAVAAFVEKAPGLRRPQGEGPMFMDLLPELAGARMLALALAAQMRIAAAEGDFGSAIIAFEQIMTVAHTIRIQPSLIDHLVGMATSDLALKELRNELSEFQFDERSCERLLEILDRLEVPSVTLLLDGERLFMRDTIQWAFTDDGNDNGYLLAIEDYGIGATEDGNRSLLWALASRFYFSDRKTIEQMLDRYIQDMKHHADKLPIDRQPSNESDGFDESTLVQTKHRFLAMVMPGFRQALRKASVLQLQTQGTRLMAAIELYHVRHGELPRLLDDIVPNILAELPIDPIHGGSFLYRQLQNDPKDRSYLLYSSGLDQQDNGGDFNMEDSFRAVNHPSANTDFLINQPRPGLDDY